MPLRGQARQARKMGDSNRLVRELMARPELAGSGGPETEEGVAEMTMTHDCRMCLCVRCYPWDEGTHNFRHSEGYVAELACDCTACSRERPLYPGHQPTAVGPAPSRSSLQDGPTRSWEIPAPGHAVPVTA